MGKRLVAPWLANDLQVAVLWPLWTSCLPLDASWMDSWIELASNFGLGALFGMKHPQCAPDASAAYPCSHFVTTIGS